MVVYEWDYEEVDAESGDILDHDFRDKLSMFSESDKTGSLCLVRDTGDDANGLEDRSWAYVKGGKLPEFFVDAMGSSTGVKVPMRFVKELETYNKQ